MARWRVLYVTSDGDNRFIDLEARDSEEAAFRAGSQIPRAETLVEVRAIDGDSG